MSVLYPERMALLIDHYQRVSCETLVQAKLAHDVAFLSSATLDDFAATTAATAAALQQAHQALVAMQGLLAAADPDIPAGPAMAAPIMILN